MSERSAAAAIPLADLFRQALLYLYESYKYQVRILFENRSGISSLFYHVGHFTIIKGAS